MCPGRLNALDTMVILYDIQQPCFTLCPGKLRRAGYYSDGDIVSYVAALFTICPGRLRPAGYYCYILLFSAALFYIAPREA